MENIRKINDNLSYIGCSDRRLKLFESAFEVPNGVSYNSYFLKDEKNVLFDTIDKSCFLQFYENLQACLNGEKLDYLIVHHVEPDHAALIQDFVQKYPEVKIVCTQKAKDMLKQFFDFDVDAFTMVVKEGDTLSTGIHTLTFYMAPMVHWPEVMVTYDSYDKILYSADAFGAFGAIDGILYDSNVCWTEYLNDFRRYYTNIVGKYGPQVQSLLKKASGLDIKMICPLHGVIIREHIADVIEKYAKWSQYIPEEKGVVIAFSSVYGGTENAAEIIASKLYDAGVKNVKMYDVSYINHSYIIADAFRYSNIVIATTTYNAGIFESMYNFIGSLVAHNLQNRTYSIVENGTWVPTCGNLLLTELQKLKNSTILENKISIKSRLKQEQLTDIDKFVKSIAETI